MGRHSSFELFEELGRGDHTIVYRGYDIHLGREVAIKELSDSCRKEPRRIERFLREAQFLAQFEHESVLSIYSVEHEQGWIVMELMQGTLSSLIAEGPSAPDLVRSVVRQVLGALDFLHQKNKVHGTVRPNNLLINDQGRVKLSEFEQADPKSELRAPSGSKKHLAPELLQPEFGEFGPALDLYCLGFTALELLSGPKFDSFFPGTGSGALDPDIAWMRWHRSAENLPPISTLAKNVPDDLAHVIDRMLIKHVNERPQSAAEVLKELEDRPLVRVPVPDAVSVSASLAPSEPHVATRVREVAPPSVQSVTQPPIVEQPKQKAALSKKKRTQSSLKPWTSAWLNDRLGKPYVLYPLCATIIVGAIAIGFGGAKKTTKAKGLQDVNVTEANEIQAALKEATVTFNVATTPQDAETAELTVLKNGAELVANKTGEHTLVTGAHTLQFKMNGFDDLQQEFDITEETTVLPIQLTRAATRVRVFVKVTPPGAELLANEKRQSGEDGTFVIDQWDNQPLQLSASSEGYDDYQDTVSPESLGTSDYRVNVKLSRTPQPLPSSLVKIQDAKIDEATGYPLRVRLRKLEGVAPLELALVRAGEYRIGVHGEAKFAWESDGRTVSLERPFYIATQETTNLQYSSFHAEVGEEVSGSSWLTTAQKYANLHGERSTENDLPVTNLSADQAAAFCAWAGGKLPSEAQWESAARGRDDHGYPHPWPGGQAADATRCRLFRGGDPQPVHVNEMVDSASADGLMHLLGNVAEWCRDPYDDGDGSQSRFVVKGCSFATARQSHVRVTWRRAANITGEWDLGFRMIVPIDDNTESVARPTVHEVLASWNQR